MWKPKHDISIFFHHKKFIQLVDLFYLIPIRLDKTYCHYVMLAIYKESIQIQTCTFLIYGILSFFLEQSQLTT